MRNRQIRGGGNDLMVFAVVLSLLLHAAVMFFAAPHVMSRISAPGAEERARQRRPPMKAVRYENKTEKIVRSVPEADVPAPKQAPRALASKRIAEDAEAALPLAAPPPEIADSGVAAEGSFPLPPPADVPAAEGGTPFSAFPAAESVAAAPQIEGPAPSAGMPLDSFIPSAGAPVPVPEFRPAADFGDARAFALPASVSDAREEDFRFVNKVLDTVDADLVEKEKAAVRRLLSAKGAARAESILDCRLSSVLGAEDPQWRYFKIVLSAKGGADAPPVVPKDMVVLIDASGSIGSDRLKRCRAAAKGVLRSCMNSGDRFNLVAFRNRFSYAFREWRECDAGSFAAADSWLSKLAAHGRTDVFSVIASVLALPRDPARPIVALVVTDGEANTGVSETAEILSRFTAMNDGLVSVYMYGVKKDANLELIDLLTRGNRGESFVHEGSRFSSGEGLGKLAAAFRDPVLTDLRIAFASSCEAETYPAIVKNLYAGRTVEVRGRCPAAAKEVVFMLQGLSGAKAYSSLYRIGFDGSGKAGPELPAEWAAERDIAAKLR